ncbi:hypothetical protein HK102_007810 [Quaeritorhiza haematococci]|nr:hypothetical protein HK102_007810 [Quaeritorhiza haematococci]
MRTRFITILSASLAVIALTVNAQPEVPDVNAPTVPGAPKGSGPANKNGPIGAPKGSPITGLPKGAPKGAPDFDAPEFEADAPTGAPKGLNKGAPIGIGLPKGANKGSSGPGEFVPKGASKDGGFAPKAPIGGPPTGLNKGAPIGFQGAPKGAPPSGAEFEEFPEDAPFGFEGPEGPEEF